MTRTRVAPGAARPPASPAAAQDRVSPPARMRFTSWEAATLSAGIRQVRLGAPEVDSTCGYIVPFRGWVAGDGPAPLNIELLCQGVTLGRLKTGLPRPDVEKTQPGHEWVKGFAGQLEAFRLPTSFSVDLVAHLEDDSRTSLGRIAGAWTPPDTADRQPLKPLMVTSLGRSGSTWLTRLLGQHPEISAYEPFRCEPRAASYWMEMYGAMSAPKSYHQILHGELYGPEWWVGTHRTPPAPKRKNPLEDWLASQHVESLLPFALDRIEAFARATAELEGKADTATHFVEKFGVGTFAQSFLSSVIPGGREILLVRDPRDMICSMLAFNRKRGFVGFGRDQVSSDEDFVGWWRGGLMQALSEWRARSEAAFRLRYEDLVLEPTETLTRLFSHIGVSRSPSLVDRVLAQARGGQQHAQKLHQTASDPAASIGRWREEFSPSLKKATKAALSDIVEGFGYAL